MEVVQNETMGQDDRTLPSLVPENSLNSLYHDAELSGFVRPLDRPNSPQGEGAKSTSAF